MNLKSLLSEIKFDYKEIIEIFRKIAAKKENIKSLWDELSKYKQQLQKEKSDDNINQKLLIIYKVSAFVEEMLLNSCQSTEYDPATGKIIRDSKMSENFVNDWNNINKILEQIFLPEDEVVEIVEISELADDQLSLLNNEQTQTNRESECFPKCCLIL
ncbi:hypothetical protein [Spiroplasma endosymbiont of Lasioglossum villosulum]|uniref:hypothetical protein n=1 Tax=Spiroplasma endosymbiont of Lasioglossum villosulum TaxID=3066320 RepID=UPI0030D452B1